MMVCRVMALALVKGTQYGVDAGLISSAPLLEPVEHVPVEPERYGILARRNNQARLCPIQIKRSCVGIVGNRFRNVLVRNGIQPGIVGLTLHASSFFSGDARDIFFV